MEYFSGRTSNKLSQGTVEIYTVGLVVGLTFVEFVSGFPQTDFFAIT